jgi:hypothetical protein
MVIIKGGGCRKRGMESNLMAQIGADFPGRFSLAIGAGRLSSFLGSWSMDLTAFPNPLF